MLVFEIFEINDIISLFLKEVVVSCMYSSVIKFQNQHLILEIIFFYNNGCFVCILTNPTRL